MGYQLWNPGKLNPLFNLYVSGYQVGEQLKIYVEKISIAHRYQEAMVCKITIRDNELVWCDLDIFNKGTEWSVALGSRDDFKTFGPFEVAGYKMSYNEQGFCSIDLDLMDKMRAMNQCVRARSWAGKNIGQIVQQIAEENGLGYDIEDGDKQTFADDVPAMQPDWTDAKFLRKLADRYGYYFAIQDGNVVFRQTQVTVDGLDPKILAWRVGTKSLMSFEPAQATFIKKGGGSGVTGQAGCKVSGPGVDIATGAAFGTQDTDDEAGEPDPNDKGWLDHLIENVTGADKEVREGGTVTAADDAKQDSTATKKVTSPSGEHVELLSGGGGTVRTPTGHTVSESALFAVFRDAVAPQRDAGDTPTKKDDPVIAAAAAGAKSDLALAKAVLTVFDVTVKQGDTMEVIGVGTRFSGQWRLYEFEHSLDASGLKTELQLGKKGLGPSSKTDAAVDKAHDDANGRNQEREQMANLFVGDRSGFVVDGDKGSWTKFQSRLP